MHVEPRVAPIEKIVIHVNVGPETEGGAWSLARYLTTIQAGYHQIADDKQLVTMAGDNKVVWGASGMNARGLHLCLIGQASQTSQEWMDAYSRGELQVAARAVANWCKGYALPVVRLSPQQVATNGVYGICGHVDVTAAFGGNNDGHSDPGPNFPWTVFLHEVALLVSPPKPPVVPIVPKPPPIVFKVTPEFNPPIPVSPVRSSLQCPSGGAWTLHEDGGVFGWGGAPFHGSPHGDHAQLRPGEVWAQIDAPAAGMKNVEGKPASYVCVTSDGDKSIY